MTAADPEGRIRHLLDVMHRTHDAAGDPIPAGYVPVADGLGQVDYVDSATFTASGAAADITVADAGGYYTGTDVEAVLAELGALVEGVQDHGNLGSTETFAATTGTHKGILNANCTFTLTALASGLSSVMALWLTQDSTGGRTITLPASVANKTALEAAQVTTLSTTVVLILWSLDGGTSWIGGWWGGSTGSALTVKDEGSNLDTAVTSIDFVGAGVTASNVSHSVTVTIPTVTAAAVSALGFVGEILISDTPSTPLVFADLLQNEAQDDLVYADL